MKSSRTLVRELINHNDQTVTVEGWLHKRRLLGGLNFIVVRDRTGIVQILIEEKAETEKLRGLQVGTVLRATGKVLQDERAPGGVELHEPKLEIMVPVTEEPIIEIDKAISHKPEHLETLFDNRVISLRNLQEQKIFRIRAAVNTDIRSYLTKQEFVEIQTPKLLAEATEGGAEVFMLDYFGKQATLAQSPQFYKQIMVGVFERVFEIGPAYRAEPSATTRHVSEVTMLDIEIGFIDGHEDVLNTIQDMTYAVLNSIYDVMADELKSLNAPKLTLTKTFPRYTVAEVHELYTKAGNDSTIGEKDLRPDEERWICEYAKKQAGCEAVFVTEMPIETHKFYQMINPENPRTVLSADLLFRGVEIATCPMREHNYDKLISQMKSKGINPDAPGFQHYLTAFKFGLPPHGGCGFGIDRFVEKIIGLANVKEAILFPRDINRLDP
jgi:nondiscriminating aspartyl-tRNA synthetase